MSISLPIPVADLAQWIPHRLPMVWIDEVTHVTATSCECVVRLKKDALYMGPDGIRESSLIEWIAQGYAFTRAAQAVCGVIPQPEKPKLAFLAAITDAELDLSTAKSELKTASIVRVLINESRELGPITMFEGSVVTESGQRLASAKLKVFAQ